MRMEWGVATEISIRFLYKGRFCNVGPRKESNGYYASCANLNSHGRGLDLVQIFAIISIRKATHIRLDYLIPWTYAYLAISLERWGGRCAPAAASRVSAGGPADMRLISGSALEIPRSLSPPSTVITIPSIPSLSVQGWPLLLATTWRMKRKRTGGYPIMRTEATWRQANCTPRNPEGVKI